MKIRIKGVIMMVVVSMMSVFISRLFRCWFVFRFVGWVGGVVVVVMFFIVEFFLVLVG